MTYTKHAQAIASKVPNPAKALKLYLTAKVLLDHHRKWVEFWRSKNNSKANRASFSVPQLLLAFSLADTRENRILIARIKRDSENLNLFQWHKPWTPAQGLTRTKLADEVEPLDPELPPPVKPSEHPAVTARLCDVVRSVLGRILGHPIDPGVVEVLVQRAVAA